MLRPWLLKLRDPESHVHKTIQQLPSSTERGTDPASWIASHTTHWNDDGTICYALQGCSDDAVQLLIQAAMEDGLIVWTNEYGDEVEYVGKQYDGERELTVGVKVLPDQQHLIESKPAHDQDRLHEPSVFRSEVPHRNPSRSHLPGYSFASNQGRGLGLCTKRLLK